MDLAPGTILASRYRIVRELGRGGMGAVYLAEHLATGNHVALKVLHGAAAGDPDSIERFRREARAPAKIGSESVVKVLDADVASELGGAPFLAMEVLQGDDLQKLVLSRGRLHPQEVVNMLTQVARALDRSHQIGIVHRDLKPENLFLHRREDGTTVVKILDFGISKLVSASMTSGGAMTQTGEVMGTPLYMSPEQAAGRVSMIGPASDVWSLGLITVFLLTGQPYFQGTTIPDVLAKVLGYAMYAPSRRWPFLPPTFDNWLLHSCARDPSARFRTAGEQLAALPGALQADTPTIHAMGDLGVLPTLPGSGPIASREKSSPRAPVATELAYGATIVGGSTDQPLVSARAQASNASIWPIVALVSGVLLLFVGAAVITASVVTNRKKDDTRATMTASPSVSEIPVVVLNVPDAALPPLPSVNKPHFYGPVPIKPGASSSATNAPTNSNAAPSASGAPANGKPSEDRQACLDDCNDQFPNDVNAAIACVKTTCPP